MQSQVIQGDCFEVLSTFPQGAFQAVFIDPPYNIGIDYGNGKQADQLPSEEYLSRMEALLAECRRCLTPTGSLWLLSPERWADQLGTALSKLLPRRNRIIWRETFGQYRESSFPSGHRHLFWHVVDPKRTPFNTEDVRVPSQRMLSGDKRAHGPRVPDDVWDLPRLVGNAHERIGDHPCQLPEELLRRVILCSTNPGDMVADPMAGTGTTLRVAQCHKRQYVGIEKQAAFINLIEQRLSRSHQAELF